jgi:hypothetical protein
MLCTVELMLAGLCINIPMLRPFYLQWRKTYKSASGSNSGHLSAIKRSNTGGLGSQQQRPGHYTQWMELVSRMQQIIIWTTLTQSSTTRTKQTSLSPATTPARNENSPRQSHCRSMLYRFPRISKSPELEWSCISIAAYRIKSSAWNTDAMTRRRSASPKRLGVTFKHGQSQLPVSMSVVAFTAYITSRSPPSAAGGKRC